MPAAVIGWGLSDNPKTHPPPNQSGTKQRGENTVPILYIASDIKSFTERKEFCNSSGAVYKSLLGNFSAFLISREGWGSNYTIDLF